MSINNLTVHDASFNELKYYQEGTIAIPNCQHCTNFDICPNAKIVSEVEQCIIDDCIDENQSDTKETKELLSTIRESIDFFGVSQTRCEDFDYDYYQDLKRRNE